jgi:hypothetical protein
MFCLTENIINYPFKWQWTKNTWTKCHRLWVKIIQCVGLSLCDKQSKFTRSECHNLGWTDNPSTLRRNVTVVNCHSRRFVGWTLRLGRNVAWSVCRWTDRLGTDVNMYIGRKETHMAYVPLRLHINKAFSGYFFETLSFSWLFRLKLADKKKII